MKCNEIDHCLALFSGKLELKRKIIRFISIGKVLYGMLILCADKAVLQHNMISANDKCSYEFI